MAVPEQQATGVPEHQTERNPVVQAEQTPEQQVEHMPTIEEDRPPPNNTEVDPMAAPGARTGLADSKKAHQQTKR